MNTRPFILITLLALAFLAINHSPAQARPEQTVLSGRGSVTNLTNPGKCIHPDHLRICRDRASVITIETNDARLTGEASFVFDSITTKAPATERVKGEFRLDNRGGAWVGILKGSTDMQGYTHFTAEGSGKGGYDGLVIRLNMESANSNWREPLKVSGTFNKGRLPAGRR